MTSDIGERVARFLRWWSGGAALLGVIAGAGVLLAGRGGLGLGSLARGLPAPPAMKGHTALGLILAGGALWLLRRETMPRRLRAAALAGAAAAGLVGGLTLVEYAGVDLGIDQFLAADPGPQPSAHGRTSPFTALCFAMLSVGLSGLGHAWLFRLGQRLAVASGFLAYLGVIAHAYGASRKWPVSAGPSYTEMALPTAVILLVLSTGVTAARPGRGATGLFVQDTAGGRVARRLLPIAMFGPFLIGAVWLSGERAGYYGPELDMALTATASIVLFSVLVWWTARRLHRADARRQRVEVELRRVNEDLEERVRTRTAELAASEAGYRRLIEQSREGIVVHQDGIVRLANPSAARLFGYDAPDDVVGRALEIFLAPEQQELVRGRVAARLRGEPVPSVVEIEGVRSDGGRLWAEATASVVEWDGMPATRVMLVDLSERHRREAAEREALALRSVAQIARAAAHEVNNPLSVISGRLGLLARKVADRPEAARHIALCDGAVRRIVEVISHMSRIARLERLEPVAGGAPMLDIRRSGGPAPGDAPAPPHGESDVAELAATGGRR